MLAKNELVPTVRQGSVAVEEFMSTAKWGWLMLGESGFFYR